MKIPCILKAFLVLPVFVFPFKKLTGQNTFIKSIVIEKNAHRPIEFASVSALKQTDFTIVTGVLTDANGLFSMAIMDTGKYLLKRVSIGFTTARLDVLVSEKNQPINLDNTELTLSAKLLEEVIVSGKNSTVTNKLDKQPYKANQFESARGGSTVDVLKNLPSVSVNSAGEIKCPG